MRRGDVYDARLGPVEGSEQAGQRPVIIVSRDIINRSASVVLSVPCTTHRPGRRVFETQIVIKAPEGGFTADSVALGEQLRALDKVRFGRRRGSLSPEVMRQLDHAILVALDLDERWAGGWDG